VNRLRVLAAAMMLAAGIAGMRGCEIPDWRGVIPPPAPDVDPSVEVWLIVVEEKGERPAGMAAFERSELRQELRDKSIRYLNVNDDDPSDVVQGYVRAIGGDVPGYLLVDGETGDVVARGAVPDPVEPGFFGSLIAEELGR